MGGCSSKDTAVAEQPHHTEKKENKAPKTRIATTESGETEENSPISERKPSQARPIQASPSSDEENNTSDGSVTSFSAKQSTPTNTSSGASTPTNAANDDSTHHSHSSRRDRSLRHSASKVGLGEMIDNKKEEGDLKNGMVHIEVPFGKPIEDVYEGVHDGPILGQGIAGLVRLITHRTTGVQYAVKCLDLRLVDTEDGLQQLREEIYIMCQLDHPNIVRLEEVYESETEIYLVQELCLGGELFDRLDEQPDYHYTEAQCARLVKQMLRAVRYIHEKGIIHRDLKLENFLFSSTSPDSELKMIDFGLGKHFQLGEVHHEAVGTPYTVAPEVIRGAYDERCDVWAIGVITYLLLSGEPPFGGCGGPEPLVEVRSNILRGDFVFDPEDIWVNVSAQAKQFIKKLLVTDPCARPTAGQAQQSPWMREWASSTISHKDRTLNPNVVKALVSFKDYSDMRKLLCEVLSFTLLPDQIEDLRKEFEKMDIDGSGEISLPGLKKVLMANVMQGTLGALTEAEVEGIFDAMRVRKTETTIHWHEFIAAGLSQCKVDDRNLKLAFDRLDSEHKGYITFENMMDLMGHDPDVTEDTMQRMWGDSMGAGNFKDARITYDDFLLLMKGQTLDGTGHGAPLHTVAETSPLESLEEHKTPPSVDEAVPSVEAEQSSPVCNDTVIPTEYTDESMSGQAVSKDNLRRQSVGSACSVESGHVMPSISVSAPNTPFIHKAAVATDFDNFPCLDIPLSMDEDDEDELLTAAIDEQIENTMRVSLSGTTSLTPPQSPLKRLGLSASELAMPPVSTRFDLLKRGRSKSVDDQDNHSQQDEEEDLSDRPSFQPGFYPKSKSLKLDQRRSFHVHRQMRLSVLESSKILEEEQLRRARETLKAQQMAEKKASGMRAGAGLVMVHGQELSSESVKKFLRQKQKEQQVRVDKANRRGGRGRRSRKKTISDIGGMLSSPPPGEILMDAVAPPATVVPSYRKTPQEASAENLEAQSENDTHSEEKKKTDVQNSPTIREPTTPGVFRKTRWDPFILSSPAIQNTRKTPGTSPAIQNTRKFPGTNAALSSSGSRRLEKFSPKLEPLDDSRHSSRDHNTDSNMNGIGGKVQQNANSHLDWPPPPPL